MKNQGILTMLQNQYKSKFPEVFNNFEKLKSGNVDPMGVLGQLTRKFSPQQMQGFMQTAKSFGVPDDILNQLQNGINPRG